MRKSVFVLFCSFVLFAVAGVIVFRHLSRIFPNYTPEQLNAIADSSRPFREALEKFKNEQGHYPTEITNLIPSYLQRTNAPNLPDQKDWAGWDYSIESSNHYQLFYQLDWDGGLSFDHSAGGSNHWSRASSGKAIDLPPSFQQR
jgi:hypothetical protein